MVRRSRREGGETPASLDVDPAESESHAIPNLVRVQERNLTRPLNPYHVYYTFIDQRMRLGQGWIRHPRPPFSTFLIIQDDRAVAGRYWSRRQWKRAHNAVAVESKATLHWTSDFSRWPSDCR